MSTAKHVQPDSVYHDLQKIDAHIHQNSIRTALQTEANKEGFRLVTINTDVPEFPDTEQQRQIASKCSSKLPGSLSFIATFSIDEWESADWQSKAIEQISKGWDQGAVAVKIWKNIGMVLQDKEERFVMADHPSFDPIYEYLAANEIPLLAHLGEPKNCWLPLEQMTVTSDKEYFTANPQYHMYLHSECPSYQDQLDARDRMLAKHNNLLFVGAHLASLEWSVDEIADWLDKHPNCGVDLAERVCHLQYQAISNHKKVKEFIETYQNRIIYGTDQIDDGSLGNDELRETIRTKWHNEFNFFANDDLQTAWNVEKPFKGLGLEKKILKKLFLDNAIRYYPRLVDS